ncbi:MAG: plasmid mobilization relaxosome protein MobC [Cyclobacteriaceae bacterium]
MSEPKEKNRLRNVRVFIRLLPEEKKAFEQRCSDAGLTQADYFRRLCLEATPLRKRKSPSVNTQLLTQYLAQIGKIGSNLNQIAKRTNAEIFPSSRELGKVTDDIMQLRTIIRKALGYDH